MTEHATPSIRAAQTDDLPHLHAIQRATLAEPAPELLSSIVEGAGLSLVAQLDRPVGYVLALTPGGVAYVPELAVESAVQRRGIGSQLLEAVVERAREAGAVDVRLTVRLEDEGARAFYREQGFDVRERLADHFETGSGTGLLLARQL
ncbi:MAG: GNAT family N-acetyltransferase [Halorhabdus sp.]